MKRIVVVVEVLFFSLFIGSSAIVAQRNSLNGLMAGTVSIDFDNSTEDGSGFLFRDSSKVYLISARHVFYDKVKITQAWVLKHGYCNLKFNLNYLDSLLTPRDLRIDLSAVNYLGKISYSDYSDIVVMQVGIVTSMDSTKLSISYDSRYVISGNRNNELGGYLMAFSEQVLDMSSYIFEGNEIFIFGFPNTLGFNSLRQFDISRPLVRKGIIAGYNSRNHTYIIDVASFRGNSGGPVVQIRDNSYRYIGIVTKQIPVNPEGDFVGNSGYSVMEPLDEIGNLIKLIKQ